MFDFTRKLTIASAAAYVAWHAAKKSDPIELKLRSGPRFELRSKSCGNNDYGVAYEIFVHEYYRDRNKFITGSVNLVVDLGANVGYSLIYYLHKYRTCRIIAYEPHPKHFAQAQRNLMLDGNRQRVELHAKAAGAKRRAMRLTDKLSSSSLTKDDGAFDVEVVDIFAEIGKNRIDILKMDIEGGEYEILEDSRFAELNIGAITMEWHSRGGGLADKRWCEDRLVALGFKTKDIFTQSSFGMLWALR